jgi:signal transduction histidine kinase
MFIAMKGIKNSLQKLTRVGVTQDLDSQEARRITYVNYLALLSALYLATRIIFSFADFIYCLKLFGMNFFVVSVLVLNHFHLYRIAKIVTFSAWVVGVAFFAYLYLGGFNEGTFVILFAAVPWPFMLFDHEKNRITIMTLLGGLILVFALLITLQYVHPLPATVDLNMGFIRISTTVLTIVTLLLLTWYFHSSNLSALATLREEKEKLEVAREAAVAANRAKSAFLANMSHELRTPLNAILGFSELMRRDPGISADQLQNLETIGRSGEHLLSLINDVLEDSKIEAGRTTLNLEEFDLHRLLFELEERFALRTRQKGISLDFTCAPDVPRYIRADPNKLRQILINLLANAVRSTASGGVCLSVRCNLGQGDNADRASLHFEIADSGCGISSQDQGKIFDAFYQSDSQPHAQQGTGLGLPISRKFVELMDGALEVRSTIGKGTTFSFDLRLEPPKHGPGTTHRHCRTIIGLASGQPAFRLLVVEDDDKNRSLTESIDNLPDDLIISLKEAVELSDSAMIDEVIEKIKTRDVSLAETLRKLAGNFAYERILELLQGP